MKEQIHQKDISIKKEHEKKMLEYKFVSEQDRLAMEDEKKKKFEKFKYLSKFRDENKQVCFFNFSKFIYELLFSLKKIPDLYQINYSSCFFIREKNILKL